MITWVRTLTRFTRATYRRARSRAIARMVKAKAEMEATYPFTVLSDLADYKIARHEALAIVARARREAGMWT